MQTIKRSYTHTNTTSQWQLIGNYHSLISFHTDLHGAKTALDSICVDSSPWGIIQIVAPGQIVTGELVHAEWEPGEQEADRTATATWFNHLIKEAK